jgi:hypothetical protein
MPIWISGLWWKKVIKDVTELPIFDQLNPFNSTLGVVEILSD